jgi:hypothetical protein
MQTNLLDADQPETLVFDPFDDMYPRKRPNRETIVAKLPFDPPYDQPANYPEDLHNKRLVEQRIIMAIKYLQPDALERYGIPNYISVLFCNPFGYLTESPYPLQHNRDAYQRVAQILIRLFDNHIAQINQIRHNKRCDELSAFLVELLPIDESYCCAYCMVTEPRDELICVCQCKVPRHIECFLQWYTRDKNQCEVCRGQFETNDVCDKATALGNKSKPCDSVFFPMLDLYPVPLMSSKRLYRRVAMDRLDMAISYLQVQRVEQLLGDAEILDGLAGHLIGYKGYKQTPLIALCGGNIGDNYMIGLGDNARKYMQIIALLVQTSRIDLNAIDAFGKTAMDYARLTGAKFARWFDGLTKASV